MRRKSYASLDLLVGLLSMLDGTIAIRVDAGTISPL